MLYRWFNFVKMKYVSWLFYAIISRRHFRVNPHSIIYELSVCLSTKWLWVWVSLQSLEICQVIVYYLIVYKSLWKKYSVTKLHNYSHNKQQKPFIVWYNIFPALCYSHHWGLSRNFGQFDKNEWFETKRWADRLVKIYYNCNFL